ncbi:MAG: DedA family protein [Deltaproteobacteria bacterium]|nr:DedA family protein [Deltaproteobacteria bacterium]
MDRGRKGNIIRRVYDWVLHWAHTPYGVWALFILAFTESSFFPIPPDVLLIALAISIPIRAFRFAFICSLGSVLGGLFGYFIGYQLMDLVGMPIIQFYGIVDKYEMVRKSYEDYNALIVFTAAFTPIPYKLITITAGASKVNILIFLIASIVGRSLRFYMVAWLVHHFGEQIKTFVDKYFNLLTILFTVILILGFVVVKMLL